MNLIQRYKNETLISNNHINTNQSGNIDLFTARNLPVVKFIDLYKGQYLNYEVFDVAPLPAVYFYWSLYYETGTVHIEIHFSLQT